MEEEEEDVGGGGGGRTPQAGCPVAWVRGAVGARGAGWWRVLRAVEDLSRAGTQVWAALGWWEVGALRSPRVLGPSVGICRNGTSTQEKIPETEAIYVAE